MYQKLVFHPGIYKDDSPLEAKGYWVDADKIRFVRGLPETIYGWERASTATLSGICRGAMTWADNGRNPFAAFGTSQALYAMDVNGIVADITPFLVMTEGVSISFTTTINSSTVSATWTGHGLVANQKISFDSSTISSVGGITIDGTYSVLSVIDSNDVVFIAGQIATSNADPTAATVNTTVFLAPGQIDGLGGLGFGTGGFGEGTYGSEASGFTLYPRSWSLAPWGQNLIANPRGGGIYEWAPNTTMTEFVTNGAFSGSATGWTLTGGGLAYGTNNLVYTASDGVASQSVMTDIAAWHRISIDVGSWSTGLIHVSYNGTNILGPLNANGTYRTTFNSGSGGENALDITGTNASLTVDNVSLEVLPYANLVPNAPAQVVCVFTTAERILVACGCTNDSGNFDPMLVAWTDAENNQSWSATATDLAGQFTLSNGSRIVRGLAGSRLNLILTDTAAYSMQYVPDPNTVYGFAEIASGCGLIGPNAVCQVGGIFYWMDPAGGFWAFDGSYPQPLQCTLARDIRDNLAFVQQDKIYAFPNTVNGRIEVWWSYPDIRDGNEVSRYVIYGVTESQDQASPVWSSGKFDRTAWANAGIFEYPLAVDSDGAIWFHEKGFTQDGGPRSWSLTSGFNDVGDGDGQMRIVGAEPDASNLQGTYSLGINTRVHNGSGIPTRSFGPYSATAATGKLCVRANGQEAQYVFSGDSAPAFWRMGAFRVDVEPSDRSR